MSSLLDLPIGWQVFLVIRFILQAFQGLHIFARLLVSAASAQEPASSSMEKQAILGTAWAPVVCFWAASRSEADDKLSLSQLNVRQWSCLASSLLLP